MSKAPAAVPGPLGLYVAGFREDLCRRGYSASPVKKHTSLMADLSRWLAVEGLTVGDVAGDAVMGRFFAARRAAGARSLRTTVSLSPLRAYLKSQGVPADAEAVEPTSPAGRLVAGFEEYLATERGLATGTIRFYSYVAALFVAEHGSHGVEVLAAGDVTAFVTSTCRDRGISSCRQVVSALRSFLRYLRLEGLSGVALDEGVLSVAGWNPQLPRGVAPDRVARILDGCDRARPIGRRDFAIIMLLARLGLRGGEVVTLRLDDIDWRRGELVVAGKGRRIDRLPLPADVGEAIVCYLAEGRPDSDSRLLFLRHFAPWDGFAGTGALRGILAGACTRAGVAYVSPHQLRHTAATQMLRAGASLREIADVLRHDSVVTTSVYAKADHAQLRLLARPWPANPA